MDDAAVPTTTTRERLEAARILHENRLNASPWSKLSRDNPMFRQYRMVCGLAADQCWDELEVLIRPDIDSSGDQFGKTPMQKTPVRDKLLRLLLSDGDPLEIWLRPLSFYPQRSLVEFRSNLAGHVLAMRFVCVMPDAWGASRLLAIPLNGKSAPIHRLNSFLWRESNNKVGFLDPAKADGSAEDYLAFFCEHIGSAEGFFHLFEDRTDIIESRQTADLIGDDIYAKGAEARFVWIGEQDTSGPGIPPGSIDKLMSDVIPITRIDDSRFRCTVVYASRLFSSVLRLRENGQVEMEEDEPLFGGRVLPLKIVRDLKTVQECLGLNVEAL